MNDLRKELYSIVSENKINNDFLYDYIIKNGIKYTSNKNGIFINLTKLNDDIVKDMYEYTNKMTINIKSREINKVFSVKKKEIIKEKYKSLPLFNSIEKEILEMSKNI